MTLNATPDDSQLALAPLDEKADHVRGSPAGHLIIEYGDYECPYSRQAFHAIEQVEQQLGGNMRFAFRHFPLTRIHPHALAAAAAAEAAARQGRFWDMHELLFHRQPHRFGAFPAAHDDRPEAVISLQTHHLRAHPHINIRDSRHVIDEVLRHRRAEVAAADQQRDTLRVPGEPDDRLAR